jgi:hypothetical protein
MASYERMDLAVPDAKLPFDFLITKVSAFPFCNASLT